jgi:hypothetical protein
LNGHPLAIGLLSTQHGLKAEVKAEVRSTSPEGLGLEFRFGHATVIMAEWPIRIFQKPENHNILYVPIKKSDEPKFKIVRTKFIPQMAIGAIPSGEIEFDVFNRHELDTILVPVGCSPAA